MESFIPTTIAYIASNVYCYFNKIPFFVGGTKNIPNKLAINGRNLLVGIFTTNTIISYVHGFSYIPPMSLLEEGVRMGIYSLMVEFWFYWSHRLMHENQWIYKYVHKEHHLETTPSPIDAYILTISESISVTISFISPIICGFVITQRGAIFVQTMHLIYGILVHGGLPGITHHMEHHKYFNGNYCGIYPLWDNVFGTRISVPPKYDFTDSKKNDSTNSIKVHTENRSKSRHALISKPKNQLKRYKSTMKPIRHIKGKLLSVNML